MFLMRVGVLTVLDPVLKGQTSLLSAALNFPRVLNSRCGGMTRTEHKHKVNMGKVCSVPKLH